MKKTYEVARSELKTDFVKPWFSGNWSRIWKKIRSRETKKEILYYDCLTLMPTGRIGRIPHLQTRQRIPEKELLQGKNGMVEPDSSKDPR